VTVFFLKRMDTSDGTETLDDFRHGNLSADQIRYLDQYLHEFSREYRYAGRIRYDRHDGLAVGIRHSPTRVRPCRALRGRGSNSAPPGIRARHFPSYLIHIGDAHTSSPLLAPATSGSCSPRT